MNYRGPIVRVGSIVNINVIELKDEKDKCTKTKWRC